MTAINHRNYYNSIRRGGQSRSARDFRSELPAYEGDYGPNPTVADIQTAAVRNTNYRAAFWTGERLQVTLMSIPADGDAGVDIHENSDIYIRVEEGTAMVSLGKNMDRLDIKKRLERDFSVLIPAGIWYNVTNLGKAPLKLSAVCSPALYPRGTAQKSKYGE